MAFGIGENWIGKAECFDRCTDLIDLALGMSARIARIGNELAHRAVGDDQPRRFYRRYFDHTGTFAKTLTGANLRRFSSKMRRSSSQVRSDQVRAGQVRASQVRAGQVKSGQSGRGESGRANQVRASQAMVPPTLVALLCVMSRVRRLPMPDIAFRSACFDTSNTCFAE